LAVAPDAHAPDLRRARIAGPARVRLARPVTLTRSLLLQRRLTARLRPAPASARTTRTQQVDLVAGETLELRP
jgi:hypothetical protein